MLWHVLRISYFIVWTLLLIHCFKSKRLFPILGSGWSTKILWLITFIFVNPLLTGLYLIFGVCLQPWAPTKNQSLRYIGSGLALCLLLVVFMAFEIPWQNHTLEPFTLGANETSAKNTPADRSPFEITSHAGILRANNNLSTTTSSSHSQNACFSDHSIVLWCEQGHPLLDRVALLLQQELYQQSPSRRVTYVPWTKHLSTLAELPEIFITLTLVDIDEARSPLGRKLNASIACEAGTSPYPGNHYINYSNEPPRLMFHINSQLHHSSELTGLESRSARYAQQAQNIAEEFTKTLTEQFKKWTDQYGQLPLLPDFLYQETQGPPDIPFLQEDSTHCILSSGGLLTNNRTTWTFKDDRPTPAVLIECRDQLKELGFKGGDSIDPNADPPSEHLAMDRGEEHISISRRQQHRMDMVHGIPALDQRPPRPFIVHYLSLFTPEQLTQAYRQLLEAEVDIETILLFEPQIHDPELREHLLALLEQHPTSTMRGYLALARLYQKEDRLDQAIEAFMLARVLTRAEREHSPETDQFKRLAKQLGDESLVKRTIDKDYFLKAGFFDLTDLSQTMTLEQSIHDPLLLCMNRSDQNLATVVLHLDPSPHAPSHLPYQVTKIVKTPNSSSIGTSDLYSKTSSVHIQNYGVVQIDIEATDSNDIRYTVHPPSGP